MRGVRIYVEGGGDGRHQKKLLRKGFNEFLGPLKELARDRRLKWNVILCGGRSTTLRDFTIAARQHPDWACYLLVDAEEAVVDDEDPVSHLRRRDAWRCPQNVAPSACHLMVQVVESWFLADADAVERYYGQGFLRNALPGREEIEGVPKDQVLSGLNRATEGMQKGRYQKIHHCAALLERLDSGAVRRRARHCERLFDVVESRIVESR